MATRYQYGSLRIRKRAKGSDAWEFRYQENGKIKAVLVGTKEKLPTKADAERAVEYLRMRINAQNPQAQFHSLTVGALVDRFINEELPKGRRFQTQLEYKTYLNRYIRKQWGDTFINDVDPVLVYRFSELYPYH